MYKSKEYLKQFSLTEKQVDIYVSLLKSGPASIMNLSNRLNLNRTTVHVLVDEMITLGILGSTVSNRKRVVYSLPPENFGNILQKERERLEDKASLIPNLIESLYKDINYIGDTTQAQIKYYNTIESIDWLYNRILESKEVKTYVNALEIVKVFPKNGERFLGAINKGVKIWDIHHYNSYLEYPFKEISTQRENFKIKRFPKSVNFDPMDFLMYDGKIAIIYGFPKPYAVEVTNDFIYKMSVSIFDFVWSVLPD